MRKKETQAKCEACGRTLRRKRYGNNRLEDFTQFSRRKFCDRSCMTKAFRRRAKNKP